MKYRLRFADLFSGCGGFSHGFVRSSQYIPMLAADSWPAAIDVYSKNHPKAPSRVCDLSDPTDRAEVVKLLHGRVDVLLGGPPCQGFSTLGVRRPNDKRSTLVDAFIELTRGIRPSVMIMENVRGIRSMRHSSGVLYPDAMRAALNPDTYNPEWYCTDAVVDFSQYGVPQTRSRFLFIAVRADLLGSAQVGETIWSNLQALRRPSGTLRRAIGDLPPLEAGEGAEEMIDDRGRVVYNHRAMKHSSRLINRLRHVPPGGGLLDVPRRLLTPHLKKMLDGEYGSGGHVKNIYGRMQWDQLSGTIVAGMDKITCGRFVHPEAQRLLTPRECARIQTFPDDFRFAGGLVTQYYLIGNAVPPAFSSILASAVYRALPEPTTEKIYDAALPSLEYAKCN